MVFELSANLIRDEFDPRVGRKVEILTERPCKRLWLDQVFV